MRDIKRAPPQINPINKSVTILISPVLYLKLKELLKTQWSQGNFRYKKGLSDIIRYVIKEYSKGRIKLNPITESATKEVNVRLDPDHYLMWKNLPQGKRIYILNSILNNWLAEELTKGDI